MRTLDLGTARVWTEEMDEPVSLPCVEALEGVLVAGGVAGPGRVGMRAQVLAETFGPDMAVAQAVVAGTKCLVIHSGCLGRPILRLADGLVVKGTVLITPEDGRAGRRLIRRLMDGLSVGRTATGTIWTVRA